MWYQRVYGAWLLFANPASVVLNASINAHIGMPNTSVYGASRAALLSLSRTLSGKLISRGIRMNAISPGPIAAPLYGKLGLSESQLKTVSEGLQNQIPARRFGTAAEVASAVVYLASDESGFMVGAELIIDGGLGLQAPQTIMKAARIHRFGSPDVIQIDEISRPTPGRGEILVRVASAGVGPWDAWIREHKSVVSVALPITLGSDIAGIVDAIGADVRAFTPGQAVFGVTNADFTGACAEFAVADAGRIARKPRSLNFTQAASAPVVAVTAWQMLFEHAKVVAGQTVLILGGGGSVGSYAVQLAAQAGLRVYATASSSDVDYVGSLGAGVVVDYENQRFADVVPKLDIVLDTVGGEARAQSIRMLNPGGVLVSALPLSPEFGAGHNIRTVFFLVDVITERLAAMTDLFDSGRLVSRVGTVLPLADVRTAHEMLAGVPHAPGKIVLHIADLA